MFTVFLAGMAVQANGTAADARSFARNLCAAVESQTEELEPKYETDMYQYQSLLADAAGVKTGDSETVVNAKIGRWLNANVASLPCNRLSFAPHDGNILKLAVARQSEPFIDDVLRTWHVDLNLIDRVDGKTVLDYIVDRRAEAGSNPNLTSIYDRYYQRFRAAGAKRAAELR